MSTISGERARLRLLRSIIEDLPNNRGIRCGVSDQDDAAILSFPAGRDLVVASDFVRGTGFDLFEAGLLGYSDIGYYLIAANLSDMAAMGAEPLALTTILRYPKDLTDDDFAAVFKGMHIATTDYGVPIVGGDIGSYSQFVLAATAFGSLPSGKGLRRKGAQPGDLLCISGVPGIAISAQLHFLKAKSLGMRLSAQEEAMLLNGWRRPTARLAEGQMLLEAEVCTAAQDSSDGLQMTLLQLAEASEVGFRVYEDQINIAGPTVALADYLGVPALEVAFSVSPDFALLFTLRPDSDERMAEIFSRKYKSFRIIGEATEKRELIFVTKNKNMTELPGRAWDQSSYAYLDELALGGRKNKL